MAKFAIFTPDAFTPSPGKTGIVVFVETANGVKRFSESEEADSAFAKFYENVSKRRKVKFGECITGFSYYSGEVGEYSGEAKKKVDATIARLKPSKVKIVEA